MRSPISRRDLEALSAYLDGQLEGRALKKLETRLAEDPAFQSALEDLRATRAVLRRAPHPRAPRNFTLTPEMVGEETGAWRLFSTMRLVSAVASVLFVFTFAGNLLTGSPLAQRVEQPEMLQYEAQESAPDIAAAPATVPQTTDKIDDAPLPPVGEGAAEPEGTPMLMAAPEEEAPAEAEPAADTEGDPAAEDSGGQGEGVSAEEGSGQDEEPSVDETPSNLAPTATLAGTLPPPEPTAEVERSGESGEEIAENMTTADQDSALESEAASGSIPAEQIGVQEEFKEPFNWMLLAQITFGLVALFSGAAALYLRPRE